MGKLRLFAFVVGAAACGSNNNAMVDAKIVIADAAPPDQKVFMDAPPAMFDFSCIGNSEPAANVNVTVSGTVNKVDVNLQTFMPTFTPLVGATVDACTGNCTGTGTGNAKLGTSTTDSMGAFTNGPYATAGSPIDGYMRMTHAGDRTSFVFPHAPLVKDVAGIPIITFAPTLVMFLNAFPGGCANAQNDAANGLMAIVVRDCMGNPISDSSNITVTVKNGSTTVGDPPVDIGSLAMGAQQARGLFIVCNVPENAAITVGASYKTMTLLSHNVAVTKGTTVETEVQPGY